MILKRFSIKPYIRVIRKKSESVMIRNQGVIEKIRQIKSEHPYWGYRRIWAYLNYRQGVREFTG